MIYDCIVVGGGVMGSATARSLAKRGRSVVLLERFDIGHKRGSSHGRTRIFRYSYPDPHYVEMAIRAHRLWRELESESGRDLMTVVGGLDLGDDIESNLNAMGELGIPAEMLTGMEANERWPSYRFGSHEDVLYQPDGAVVGAEDSWRALAELASDDGADVRVGTTVTALEPQNSSVVVRIGETSIEATTCVVTAGAWAKPLLATAGIELEVRPTRETVSYYSMDVGPVPTLVHWTEPLVYALPSPGQGLKVGEHIAGPEADPNEDGAPSEESVERVAEWVARHVPGADPTPHHRETCFYTNTTDEHFVLRGHGNIIVGSPCSGHGFKFAPLIGEMLADLVDERF